MELATGASALSIRLDSNGIVARSKMIRARVKLCRYDEIGKDRHTDDDVEESNDAGIK
jgi:hypothetical protein